MRVCDSEKPPPPPSGAVLTWRCGSPSRHLGLSAPAPRDSKLCLRLQLSLINSSSSSFSAFNASISSSIIVWKSGSKPSSLHAFFETHGIFTTQSTRHSQLIQTSPRKGSNFTTRKDSDSVFAFHCSWHTQVWADNQTTARPGERHCTRLHKEGGRSAGFWI